jgi:hypothetical protein
MGSCNADQKAGMGRFLLVALWYAIVGRYLLALTSVPPALHLLRLAACHPSPFRHLLRSAAPWAAASPVSSAATVVAEACGLQVSSLT